MRKVAVVVVGQTEHKYRRRGMSYTEMVYEAVKAVLEDANLEMRDIEAIIFSTIELFEGQGAPEKVAQRWLWRVSEACDENPYRWYCWFFCCARGILLRGIRNV